MICLLAAALGKNGRYGERLISGVSFTCVLCVPACVWVDEAGGALAGIGSKLGAGAASLGKKVAQSEAGRSAGKAAVRGATDAAAKDLTDRYLGAGSYTKQPQVASAPAPATKSEGTTKSVDHHEPSSTSEHRAENEEKTVYTSLVGQETYGRQEKASVFSKIIPSGLPDLLTSKSSSTPKSAKRKVYKSVVNTEADWDTLPVAQTLYNFRAEMKCDLEFRKGQLIKVLTRTDSTNDWWEGRIDDRVGIFPANYVKLLG